MVLSHVFPESAPPIVRVFTDRALVATFVSFVVQLPVRVQDRLGAKRFSTAVTHQVLLLKA